MDTQYKHASPVLGFLWACVFCLFIHPTNSSRSYIIQQNTEISSGLQIFTMFCLCWTTPTGCPAKVRQTEITHQTLFTWEFISKPPTTLTSNSLLSGLFEALLTVYLCESGYSNSLCIQLLTIHLLIQSHFTFRFVYGIHGLTDCLFSAFAWNWQIQQLN